jgi:hypothetical protein
MCGFGLRCAATLTADTQVRPIRCLPAVATIGCVTLTSPTPVLPTPTGQLNRHRLPTHRLALAALLAATSVLFIWGLSASGWANSFYAAAVQAGSKSWTAFLFGSSDAATRSPWTRHRRRCG